MQSETSILDGRSDLEKCAYLAAIASIATADRVATQDEQDRLMSLINAANLSDRGRQYVQSAAADVSGTELNKSLAVLRESDLKYALVADLMAFAKADDDYNEQEQHSVQRIAEYLGVDHAQFAALDQFAEGATISDVPPERYSDPALFTSSEIGNKLRGAGINGSGLVKGIIALAAPLLLSKMFGGPRTSGNMGSPLRNEPGAHGGFGSLIGMLSGGRGAGNFGSLLGRALKGVF